MRSFFNLGFAPEHNIGRAVELEDYDLGDFDYQKLMAGEKLGAIPKGVKLVVKQSRPDSDVIVNCLNWLVVSKRLAAVFKEYGGSQIELLPVDVLDASGQPICTEFVIVNALQMYDALSSSKTLRSPVKIGTRHPILKLAIQAHKIPEGSHIFRVCGAHFDLLVDKPLKDAVCATVSDGIGFTKIETE